MRHKKHASREVLFKTEKSIIKKSFICKEKGGTVRKRNEYCLREANLVFHTKCKFIMNNSSFKMLVVFSPIFCGEHKNNLRL